MGLLDLKTDLKSLKFGVPPATDTPGGGNSGQPYITNPIDRNIVPQSEDFLLRGGLNAPLDAAQDVVRLTKFFGDLKSPRGVLFVAKQNLLSRTGVATQASGNTDWKNAPLNEGLYTPLSTIAQAGVGFAGAHLYKQGLNPLKGVRTYTDIIKGKGIDENQNFIADNSIVKIDNNRLVNLLNEKSSLKVIKSHLDPNNDTAHSKNKLEEDVVNIYSYLGGPGSSLGIGKTNIKFATNNLGAPLRTGKENIQLQNSGFFNTPSLKFFKLMTSSPPLILSNPTGFDVFRGKSNKISDFREEIFEISKSTTSIVTGIAPDYSNAKKTLEGVSDSRINLVSPGQKGNRISYTKGKIVAGEVSVVDRINAQPIYKSSYVKGDSEVAKNDLVKFRIGAILRSGEKVFMHFRAFLNSFSDNYSANWQGIKYMGRGEEFYKYGGFGRKISLSYTVAAQSKPEIMAQYKKLNFLASTLAPDYGSSGYMGGVLTSLTLGGWCYELPGFINSLNLEIPQESPWEIAINDNVSGGKGTGDPTVKEMPMICNVNMEFTPIHKFRPELQKNNYGDDGFVETTFYEEGDDRVEKGTRSVGQFRKGYGDQRYIALTNGASENYNNTKVIKVDDPGGSKDDKGNIKKIRINASL